MSGAAGGGVEVVAGALIAVPALAVAGVAYGVAAGVNFAVDQISDAWEERERLVELERRQMQIKQGRFDEYNAAVAQFQRIARLAASVDLEVPHLPCDLTPESDLQSMQEAMVGLQVATARLTRAYDAAATTALAEATRRAVTFTSTQRAHRVDDSIAAAQERLAAREAAEDRAMQNRLRALTEQAAEQQERRVRQLAARVEKQQRDRIAKALAGLPADLDPQTKERIQQWCERLPTLRDGDFQAALLHVETICRRAAADAAERAHSDTTAAAVVTALAGCTTPVAKEITSRAQRYLAGELAWEPELPSKARAELERITSELEDLAAAEILAESLQELGYEVGPGFETAVVGASGAFVHHADWGDTHAMQVQLGRDDTIAMQVVREGDPDTEASDRERAEDQHAEQMLCDRLDAITETAAGHGLRIALNHRIDPGDEPVQRVRDTGRGTVRQGRAHTTGEQEMAKGTGDD